MQENFNFDEDINFMPIFNMGDTCSAQERF